MSTIHTWLSIIRETAQATNPRDEIKVDVPLMLRLLEYAREEVKSDNELHRIVETLVELSSDGTTLTMSDFSGIVGNMHPMRALIDAAKGGRAIQESESARPVDPVDLRGLNGYFTMSADSLGQVPGYSEEEYEAMSREEQNALPDEIEIHYGIGGKYRRATMTEPEEHPYINGYVVVYNGRDVSECLSEIEIQMIEEKIWEDADEHKDDAAMARYDAKREDRLMDESADAKRLEFSFGYDGDAIGDVMAYVKAHYSEDEYKMSIGLGDDFMNYLEIVDRGDAHLMELIDGCEGGGQFED